MAAVRKAASPMQLLARGIAILSFLVMLHSGYTAREYIQYSKAIDRADTALPVEITAECLVSLAVMTVALVFGVGELRPISYEAEMKQYRIDGIDSRPSFQTFNHRGKTIRPVTGLQKE